MERFGEMAFEDPAVDDGDQIRPGSVSSLDLRRETMASVAPRWVGPAFP